MRRAMILLTTLGIAGLASATLPPPSDSERIAAAETKAKSAWSDKVDQYKLCLAVERTAAAYSERLKANAEPVPEAMAAPECSDPGPYVSLPTPLASKPLEASGAHSPPGAATSPPSTNRTAAEIDGKQ